MESYEKMDGYKDADGGLSPAEEQMGYCKLGEFDFSMPFSPVEDWQGVVGGQKTGTDAFSKDEDCPDQAPNG